MQAMPQAPQLAALPTGFVQVPPQQSQPPAQEFPHTPQFAGSCVASVHAPAQHESDFGQGRWALQPGTQVLARHTSPSAQWVSSVQATQACRAASQ
jgi:hypothetical protein